MLQYLLVARSSSWKHDLVTMLLIYCSLCMFSYVRVHVVWSIGHGNVLCWCKCCMQWKIFKFHIFIVSLHILSFKWYQSLVSHDLHAKCVDNCKCCDYACWYLQELWIWWLNTLMVTNVVIILSCFECLKCELQVL